MDPSPDPTDAAIEQAVATFRKDLLCVAGRHAHAEGLPSAKAEHVERAARNLRADASIREMWVGVGFFALALMVSVGPDFGSSWKNGLVLDLFPVGGVVFWLQPALPIFGFLCLFYGCKPQLDRWWRNRLVPRLRRFGPALALPFLLAILLLALSRS